MMTEYTEEYNEDVNCWTAWFYYNYNEFETIFLICAKLSSY